MFRTDELASPSYRALLRERYTRPGWGASGHSWAKEVEAYATKLGASTILDYGCGRGTLRRALPNHEVHEYDPGIVGKDGLPEPVDLVVCTDVLEHVEPNLLDTVLVHLKTLARLGLLLNIATSPSREILADGRNAHLIQKDMRWWIGKLTQAGFAQTKVRPGKGFCVWIRM